MKRYLYHNVGENACNGKALEYVPDILPDSGDPLRASDYRHLDGTAVAPGEAMYCGSCGKPFERRPRIKDIK